MDKTLELAQSLIAINSVTPDDNGCQELMIQRLEKIGFTIERLRFDDVDNFWARRGSQQPVLAFAGHTDVVPAGALDQWESDPFTPTIIDGQLHGRGAADMKGSLAAMVVAVEEFIQNHPDHDGSIAFLITSDEEGLAVNGTKRVMQHLSERKEKIDWCVIGEPSSTEQLGDIVKNGRRGSLSGDLTIHGHQGHIAYPHLAENPIHRFAAALKALTDKQWDAGNDYFPPTSFQISNINAGVGANNVIPGELTLLFNFRYSTETTQEALKKAVEDILQSQQLRYTLKWWHSGHPFLTKEGQLTSATANAIRDITGRETTFSTTGGTSDGRFIALHGVQVVELGPVNASIHKVNEHTSVDDLQTLTQVYKAILQNLLC